MGKRRDSLETVQKSVVRVKDTKGQTWGTGFFISGEGHCLTCAHVVDDAGGWKNLRILDHPVRCLYEGDRERDDFCLLQVEDVPVTWVELGKDFDPGDEFLSFGFSNENFYGAPIRGEITAFARCGQLGDQKLIRLETFSDAQRIEGGQSGAPFFVYQRGKYKVVGLIVASEDLNGGLAIPSEAILSKISSLISSPKDKQTSIKRLIYINGSLLFVSVIFLLAYSIFQSSLSCSTNLIQDYRTRIQEATSNEQERQALSYADELVLKCPKNYLSYLYKGNVLVFFKKPNEAIPEFQKTIRNNPRSVEAKYNLAIAYRDSKQYEQAISTLIPLLEDIYLLDPKSYINANSVRFQLGYNYIYTAWEIKVAQSDKIKSLESARDLYQQVMDNTPANCCSGNATENECCPTIRADAADHLAAANAILYNLTGDSKYLKESIKALEIGLRSKSQAQRIVDIQLIQSGIEIDFQQQIKPIRSTKEFSEALPRLRAISGL